MPLQSFLSDPSFTVCNAAYTAFFASSPLADTAQSLALLSVAVLLVAGLANLLVRLSVWLLNRTCRYCREASRPSSSDKLAARGTDRHADKLRAAVESLRREEESLAERYSIRQCAAEDVIRAKSLRMRAEIALLRHERMPRSWAEVCGEAQRVRGQF